MLNKQICKKCLKEHNIDWHSTKLLFLDENGESHSMWNPEKIWNEDGTICCPEVKRFVPWSWHRLRIDRFPPISCPFYLEHLLEGKRERE